MPSLDGDSFCSSSTHTQLREQIVGRLDVAERHQEFAQSVIVQRIRLVGVPVRYHDSAVAPHSGVTCGRLATCAGGNAGDEQRVDAVRAQ